MKVEKRKQITAEALYLDLEGLKQNKPDGGKKGGERPTPFLKRLLGAPDPPSLISLMVSVDVKHNVYLHISPPPPPPAPIPTPSLAPPKLTRIHIGFLALNTKQRAEGGNITNLILWGTLLRTLPIAGRLYRSLILWGTLLRTLPIAGRLYRSLILWGTLLHTLPIAGRLYRSLILWGTLLHTLPLAGRLYLSKAEPEAKQTQSVVRKVAA